VTPNAVIIDYVAVSKQIFDTNSNVTICRDILFVTKIPFIATISRNIKFTTVAEISSCTMKQLVNCMTDIKTLYARRGFRVTKVCTHAC
jgi:type III secretory pathway component EscU